MDNGPFIDGLPTKNGDFPWLLNNQMVNLKTNFNMFIRLHSIGFVELPPMEKVKKKAALAPSARIASASSGKRLS